MIELDDDAVAAFPASIFDNPVGGRENEAAIGVGEIDAGVIAAALAAIAPTEARGETRPFGRIAQERAGGGGDVGRIGERGARLADRADIGGAG